jgi:hypothetical protein
MPTSDSRRGASDMAPAHGEAARWVRIENGVREDAALLARRIDSVRTEGIGAE